MLLSLTFPFFSLLEKTERVINVKFSEQETLQYSTMEATSRAAYLAVKNSRCVGKRYLYLMQKLAPLRIACAGGHVPLDDGVLDSDGAVDTDSGGQSVVKVVVADDNNAGKKINRKVITFSKFAFTSKLEALISELENIREKDETGMSHFTCSSFVRDFDILIIFSQPNVLYFHSFHRH